jgi:hypothetical protein
MLEQLPDLFGHDPAVSIASRGGILTVPDVFTPAQVIAAAGEHGSQRSRAITASACVSVTGTGISLMGTVCEPPSR